MTWLKLDDGWAMHPKIRAAGLHGRALWVAAGNQCAAKDTDGHVEAHMVDIYAVIADTTRRRAVPPLVSSGLWHDEATITACHRCHRGDGHDDWSGTGPLRPGGYYFHDWREYQLNAAGKTDSIARKHELRGKNLRRNARLTAAIRERDRDLCRYCGVHAPFTDRKSKRGGTYDHRDPFGGNTLDNVVVACRGCNAVKGNRTPEQAGMVLLPVPAAYLAASDPGLDPSGPNPTGPDSGQTVPRVTRESGQGRIGSDPGQISGQIAPAQIPAPANGNGSNGSTP